jgi:hypothetical protein
MASDGHGRRISCMERSGSADFAARYLKTSSLKGLLTTGRSAYIP